MSRLSHNGHHKSIQIKATPKQAWLFYLIINLSSFIILPFPAGDLKGNVEKRFFVDVVTFLLYILNMIKFEWDIDKEKKNIKKHSINFNIASKVFLDPFFVSKQDRIVDGEKRWQTIGIVNNVKILLVAHTMTDDNADTIIRIISARRATNKERRLYYGD